MSPEALPDDWMATVCNGTLRPAEAAAFLHRHFHSHNEFEDDIAIVAATLYCWEFLMTLPAELRIYLTIPWTAPHLILFVLMRYSTMVTVAMGMYSTWHRFRGNCVTYRDAAVLMVQLSVSAVLGWRTVAIWQKDARIFVIVALLLITLMVFSSLIVLGTHVQPVSSGECILTRGDVEELFPLAWFYAGTVAYDTAVIVLSTFRLWQHHNDVGVFPGANADDSRRWCSWISWLHSQWNSVTPLLFRLTSNGVLYLAFSTVFNVVCFAVSYDNEDRAQNLLLLYSSVMWVVCQHLMLLEIRATWGNSSAEQKFGTKGPVDDSDADRLIAQILQASWSQKARGEAKTLTKTDGGKDIELGPTLQMGCGCGPGGGCSCAGVRESLALSLRDLALARSRSSDECDTTKLSVQQLHGFRPCMPGESYDGSAQSSMHRVQTAEADTSSTALVTDPTDEAADGVSRGFRGRLSAISNSPTRLFATFKTRSDGPTALDHPLQHAESSHCCALAQKAPARSRRFSQVIKKAAPVSAEPACNCRRPRRNTLGTLQPPATDLQACADHQDISCGRKAQGIEVAAMLASMSPDDKAAALALAGMDASPALPSYPPFASTMHPQRASPAKVPTTIWMMQPPLI
ncbi:hypothetical protein PaG_03448 [Moesziomyces aphidis]|uniref:Transmembrane protein n=1 Tax=Moesziomyces aphidis TaxID=84754 RepID=W3VL28_MOEAP|nr:hypothetical protein PaG_03448 [Moesziomyces aphidis]